MINNLYTDKMQQEIETAYSTSRTLFISPQPSIKNSRLIRFLEEKSSYDIASTSTLKRNIPLINFYFSAIYYEKHHLYNHACINDKIFCSAKIEDLINESNLPIYVYIKELQTLPTHTQLFYYRLYNYLAIENVLSLKNHRYDINSYPIPLLLSPLFIGLIRANKLSKSYKKAKEVILEITENLLNEKNYFSYLSDSKYIPSNEIIENLQAYYSYWIDLMLPNQFYDLYTTLLEKRNKNNNSKSPFARIDNVPLNQLISLLPQQNFLSSTGYEIYYSEILYLLDNSTDFLQDINNVREEITQHEFNLWNQVAQQYEK